MAMRVFFGARTSILSSSLLGIFSKPLLRLSTPLICNFLYEVSVWKVPNLELHERFYHDGRPRGPLWRGKKLLGKEALFVILGMKRFKHDEEKLDKFIKSHVLRLLKLEKITVLNELERQEEVGLALKCF